MFSDEAKRALVPTSFSTIIDIMTISSSQRKRDKFNSLVEDINPSMSVLFLFGTWIFFFV